MLELAAPSFKRYRGFDSVSEQTSCASSGASKLLEPKTVLSSMLQQPSISTSTTELEASYLRDVLRLQNGDSEEQLDSTLRAEAGEISNDTTGQTVEDRGSYQTKARSSGLSRRSQESIASKMSQSTGMTSNMSDASRENYSHLFGRNPPRASLSFRDYDAFLARGTPSARHSFSTSPPTTPSQSTFSLPLSTDSSPKKHFSRLRGLSMLKLYRTTSASSISSICSHCPPGQSTQRKAVHKLPCGHRLCTEGLRDIVIARPDGKTNAVPSHCTTPIPGHLVEHVMTQAEQTRFLEQLGQWDENTTVPSAEASKERQSSIVQPPGRLAPSSRSVSDDSKLDFVNPQIQKDLDTLMETPEYKQMKIEQAEIRDRFLAWVESNRTALDAEHHRLKEELRSRHETSLEELLERHNAAMCDAEDKQVKAEADMRESHSQEKRDNATALKHMEAYCAGTYSTGEAHMRTVTDSDRSELEKTRRIRDQMDARHESAINVLRGEQSRRIKLRAQRQGREAQELGRAQRKEELELERVCNEKVHQLDELVTEKRQRLRMRWQLQTAILVKKSEKSAGMTISARLPAIDWQPAKLESSTATDVQSGVGESSAIP